MTLPVGQSSKRWCLFLFAVFLGLVLLGVVGPRELTPALHAQESSSSAEEGEEDKNMVAHILDSLKWFLPLLGFVSIAMIAICVLLAMDLRMGNAVPADFVADFTDIVNKRQFKGAYDLARNDSSMLGKVMTVGMGRLQYGIEDARDAAFQMVDTVRSNKEQMVAYLATIGTLGPLFGLVGTVWGMIGAFRQLGKFTIDPKTGNKVPKISSTKLAEEISHALCVTLVGVALSVPAIFFHTFFRNRIMRLSMETSNVADDLLTQMYHNSKKPGGPTQPEMQLPPADNRAGAAQAAIKPK